MYAPHTQWDMYLKCSLKSTGHFTPNTSINKNILVYLHNLQLCVPHQHIPEEAHLLCTVEE